MKRLVLFLLALAMFQGILQAQSKKELQAMLQRNLEDFKAQSLKPDFDSLLHYTPPKLFDLYPKDSLLAFFRNGMDNEMMHIDMTGMAYDAKKPYKIKKAGKYYWTTAAYSGGMYILIKKDKAWQKIMVNAMKSTFGSQNVEADDKNGMNVKFTNKRLIAFKDPEIDHWYLMEDKREIKNPQDRLQRTILETVLPEEVLKAVGQQ